MLIELPFAEALAFARSQGPLPDLLRSISCEGSTISAEIDLRMVESSSLGARLALAAAGTVLVTVRPAGFADGVAKLAVTAHARGLPAHRLLPYLAGPIDDSVVAAGLPSGVVGLEDGDGGPLVRIDVQRALDTRVEGVTVTGFDVTDASIRVTADIGVVRVVDEPAAHPS